jgi:hypothetical protein
LRVAALSLLSFPLTLAPTLRELVKLCNGSALQVVEKRS